MPIIKIAAGYYAAQFIWTAACAVILSFLVTYHDPQIAGIQRATLGQDLDAVISAPIRGYRYVASGVSFAARGTLTSWRAYWQLQRVHNRDAPYFTHDPLGWIASYLASLDPRVWYPKAERGWKNEAPPSVPRVTTTVATAVVTSNVSFASFNFSCVLADNLTGNFTCNVSSVGDKNNVNSFSCNHTGEFSGNFKCQFFERIADVFACNFTGSSSGNFTCTVTHDPAVGAGGRGMPRDTCDADDSPDVTKVWNYLARSEASWNEWSDKFAKKFDEPSGWGLESLSYQISVGIARGFSYIFGMSFITLIRVIIHALKSFHALCFVISVILVLQALSFTRQLLDRSTSMRAKWPQLWIYRICVLTLWCGSRFLIICFYLLGYLLFGFLWLMGELAIWIWNRDPASRGTHPPLQGIAATTGAATTAKRRPEDWKKWTKRMAWRSLFIMCGLVVSTVVWFLSLIWYVFSSFFSFMVRARYAEKNNQELLGRVRDDLYSHLSWLADEASAKRVSGAVALHAQRNASALVRDIRAAFAEMLNAPSDNFFESLVRGALWIRSTALFGFFRVPCLRAVSWTKWWPFGWTWVAPSMVAEYTFKVFTDFDATKKQPVEMEVGGATTLVLDARDIDSAMNDGMYDGKIHGILRFRDTKHKIVSELTVEFFAYELALLSLSRAPIPGAATSSAPSASAAPAAPVPPIASPVECPTRPRKREPELVVWNNGSRSSSRASSASPRRDEEGAAAADATGRLPTRGATPAPTSRPASSFFLFIFLFFVFFFENQTAIESTITHRNNTREKTRGKTRKKRRKRKGCTSPPRHPQHHLRRLGLPRVRLTR